MEMTQWDRTMSVTRKEHGKWGAGIYPPPVFQALLRHERSRSDREGSEFSLVVLDLTGSVNRERDIQHMAHVIQDKMRSIDEVGWLETRKMAALLPATNAEGGRQFARRVCESIRTPASPIPWTVYTYPDHWLPGGNGQASRYVQPAEPSTEADNGADHVLRTVDKVFSRLIPLWKRSMDLVGSLLFLAVSSPLFLLLTAYIKVVSPGKAFYRQKRVGQHGKLFTFIKFRTMAENNDAEVHREYLKELINSTKAMEKLDGERDPRIIPGGKIIRKACLDELPQLFNVIRGDMSLVGPRPCIPYEAEEYMRWHTHRFDILPGMTGLWQVSGKNKLSFAEMVRLDISYANRMSPLLDLKILFLTIPAILRMVLEAGLRRTGTRVLEPTVVNLASGDGKGVLGDA